MRRRLGAADGLLWARRLSLACLIAALLVHLETLAAPPPALQAKLLYSEPQIRLSFDFLLKHYSVTFLLFVNEMSGFEIVGVILGVYPVLQGILEVYKATKGRKGAVSLARQLMTEEIIFQEFVDHLVSPTLSDTGTFYHRSLAPLDLTKWRSEKLKDDIRARLGPAKAENLLAILEEIWDLLNSLQEELAPAQKDHGVV